MSPEAFLTWEDKQPERYELVDGIPYAMAGAGRLHEAVAGALFAILWAHLEGKSCQAYKSDLKVQVGDDFFYPDIVVTCDAVDRRADVALAAPVAIVEVLSRPTAAYDRGEKRERYQVLASLQTYLLVNPETREVERYERASNWARQVLPPSEPIAIAAIGFSCEQQRVFAAL
jgi:Uma2 family endonuclease